MASGDVYDLIVERDQISFTGADCNKIGTAYTAFNNQPGSACSQMVGSCLSNQIYHLIEEDKQRIGAQTNPKYLIKSYGLGMGLFTYRN